MQILKKKKYYVVGKKYLGLKIVDQDKRWAPHICCKTCTNGLPKGSLEASKSIPLGMAMIEPQDSHSD